MKDACLALSLSLLLTIGGEAVAAQQAVPADRFSSCLSTLRGEAASKGVSAASFDRLTKGLAPDLSVLEFLDYQPEFRTPIWDYLAGLVDDERVADALAMREKWLGPLAAAGERYQVDADTVLAVWGCLLYTSGSASDARAPPDRDSNRHARLAAAG